MELAGLKHHTENYTDAEGRLRLNFEMIRVGIGGRTGYEAGVIMTLKRAFEARLPDDKGHVYDLVICVFPVPDPSDSHEPTQVSIISPSRSLIDR